MGGFCWDKNEDLIQPSGRISVQEFNAGSAPRVSGEVTFAVTVVAADGREWTSACASEKEAQDYISMFPGHQKVIRHGQ